MSAKDKTGVIEAGTRNTDGLTGVQVLPPPGAGGSGAGQGDASASSGPSTPEEAPVRKTSPLGASLGAVSPPEEWRSLIRFEGKGSAYFGLLFKTFIFSLFTLGIYSFWGRTLQRRYLWENTLLLGEPLEYTGTGKELFLSFLIVVPILLLLVLAGSFAATMLGVFGTVIFYLPFIFAWQFAIYRALRFRLTRTRWRGIRGNMSGSALLYGVKATGYLLVAMVSLGLLYPWASGRMADAILNNVWFGNRKLAFSGSVRRLYKTYLLGLLGGVIGGAIAIVIFYNFFFVEFYTADNVADILANSVIIIANILFFIILVLPVFLICRAFYQAAFFRWLFEHASFGNVRSRSTLSGGQMLGISLTNFLLIVCTLGLGIAWAVIRMAKAKLNSVQYMGDPRLDELLQDTKEAPKSGEGLLDALDVDIAL
jgi:uncharacterized membrane protein YjgN (DUF898 family)